MYVIYSLSTWLLGKHGSKMRKFCRCRVNIDKCKSCINSRRMDLTGFFNRITIKLENVKFCARALGPTAPPRMLRCFYEQQQWEENQQCDSPVVVREARVKVRTRQYRWAEMLSAVVRISDWFTMRPISPVHSAIAYSLLMMVNARSSSAHRSASLLLTLYHMANTDGSGLWPMTRPDPVIGRSEKHCPTFRTAVKL